MEDGILKQTHQGKTERPTLQARMIPPWTWFQTAPGTGTTNKVVHSEMLHAQPGSIAYQYHPWLLYVLYFP
jgi:hypothetical protein